MYTGPWWIAWLCLTLAALGCGKIVAAGDPDTGDVAGENHPPEIAPVAPMTVTEGEEVSFVLEVSDPDDDAVALTLESGPKGAVLDGPSRQFSWTPGFDVAKAGAGDATANLKFVADDGRGGSDTLQVAITVRNDNDEDGIPDAMDDDDDGDGLSDELELAQGTSPYDADHDDDATGDAKDNCPTTPNADQLDTDGDHLGDACDDDDDDDGVLDSSDNCPLAGNQGQADNDSDGAGDACDPDRDGDGVGNGDDNCPDNANPDQGNSDKDSNGDACDDDDDNDGVSDSDDNCPLQDPSDQTDTDGDGEGDVCDADDDDDGIADDGDGSGKAGDNPCKSMMSAACDDNCRLVKNPTQFDGDADGLGDDCDGCPDDPSNDDKDEDKVCGPDDNCPDHANPKQTDTDGDGQGDACDEDDDGDGVKDTTDNCPIVPNPGQESCDTDGKGNACDDDDDDDGVLDGDDNCPCAPNADQVQHDGDGLGDACDDDDDGDGVPDIGDNCPTDANDGQEDFDKDGLGDVCDEDDDGDGVLDLKDNCPFAANKDQKNSDGDAAGDACDDDDDNDTIPDGKDNCPLHKNPVQEDLDGDKQGDACDEDDDGDGVPDEKDNCPLVPNPPKGAGQLDVDGDGKGAACDDLIEIPLGEAAASITNADGDARAGTVAIVLEGSNSCGGPCADASLFVLEKGVYATLVHGWAKVKPSGDVFPPFVGAGGAALLRAEQKDTTIRFDRVFEGALKPLLEPAGPPLLNDGPDGTTLAEVPFSQNAKLYSMIGGSDPVGLWKFFSEFVDMNGSGAVRGGDGVLYYPGRATTGTKYSLRAMTSAGKDLAVDQHEVAFLTMEPGSGFPWYCMRLTSGSPAVVRRFQGAAEGPSLDLVGATCADLSWARGPAGVFWLTYAVLGTLDRKVVRWNPGGGSSAEVMKAAGEASFHFAGKDGTYETYIRTRNGNTTDVYWFDSAGTKAVPVIQGATMAGLQDSNHCTNGAPCAGGKPCADGSLCLASTSGAYGLVYRTAASASPVQATLVTKGTAVTAELAPSASSVPATVQDVWVSPQSILWAHVLEPSSKPGQPPASKLYDMAKVDATNALVEQPFTTAGKAKMTFHGPIGILGIDGTASGLYRVVTKELTPLADAIADHDVLAESGTAVFVTYKKTLLEYELGRVDLLSNSLDVVASDLTGPPLYSVFQPEAGRQLFIYETGAGSTYAFLEKGQSKVWKEELALIQPVTWSPSGLSQPWGALMKKGFDAEWTWCSLPPGDKCWTMPTSATLSWHKVDSSGTIHAVYFEGGKAMLWRNLFPSTGE